MTEVRQAGSVREVVESGLCIGCGLCEALAPERWVMRMNRHGRLRPAPVAAEESGADAEILAACPGVVARADAQGDRDDAVWGSYTHMGEAWAGDPDIRFRASSGGVLTALGVHLLRTGKAAFVLHCAADPGRPMRSRWVMSDTPEELAARAGSRYGPSDTLAGLEAALARGEPFAVIAKPCDAGAVRARAKADARLDSLLVAVLVMVCGGASDLGKSQAVLDELGVAENELALFRYRGHGNPGPTRIETRDGRHFEKTYNEMWADEAGWRIQSRCKLCPDAIGEAADVAAADIWPGAEPDGEDDGFNGVIVRSPTGQALFDAAVSAGDLVRGADHSPRDYDRFQPHQVDRKQAMAARLRGLAAAGRPVYAHGGLRLDTLDSKDPDEEAGALRRAKVGRFDDEVPEP
ncbi:Coenzyme F420 hydrogenase/dehydrogenase, beta subunit C-terminal domain [Roseovarius sp. MMSF_3350]|uniref:Coenzyme F420 hydrogenase/dehydrogenase, beta subunit C-terminal domain n=1 Tax=Roseovarius sp. MMSF_3350 TaxID=3046706 RepID=UPI00273DB94A|nr:Coenzyme F420 hydrogenase/dehydrogenase, beta subunit C-terminal domain [Roseovarius sp. MMSF_3350]